MTPGELITPEEAHIARGCGIVVRPWFGAAVEHLTGPKAYYVMGAPANALSRYGAYRMAVIATWPPEPGEAPEAHHVRQAEAMAAETDTGGKYACKYCHRKDGTHTANCRKPVARKPGAKKVAVKSARPVVSPYGQAIEALRAKRDGIDAAIKELEALG